MNVLFVIGSMSIGGAELQLIRLIKGLVKQGIRCRVFSMEGDGPLTPELNSMGVTVIDGGYRSGPGKIWLLRQLSRVLFRLVREIERKPCDVLHAYLPMANFIGTVSGRVKRVPCILTSKRALGTHRQRGRLWYLFDFVSNRYCNRVVVNSEGVRDDALTEWGMSDQKITLIHNGIDTRNFLEEAGQRDAMRASLGLNTDELIVIMIANLIPYKGHSDAFKALALLRTSGQQARMLIVGDDRGIKKALEAEAKGLCIDESLLWLGHRDDVPALLAAADIGLIASHEEGFCNALLEMMAAGLPVVATRVGGNSEALGQGELGILVDAQAPQQIAEALQTLGEAPDLGGHFGEAAAQAVRDKYSVDYMVSKFLDLYANGCKRISVSR